MQADQGLHGPHVSKDTFSLVRPMYNYEAVGIQLIMKSFILTLVLLNSIYPVFTNSVDPDQLASEEAS